MRQCYTSNQKRSTSFSIHNAGHRGGRTCFHTLRTSGLMLFWYFRFKQKYSTLYVFSILSPLIKQYWLFIHHHMTVSSRMTTQHVTRSCSRNVRENNNRCQVLSHISFLALTLTFVVQFMHKSFNICRHPRINYTALMHHKQALTRPNPS